MTRRRLLLGSASLVGFTVVLAMTGCFSVRLIAEYDPQLDQGLTAFQRKMETHFTKLERVVGTDEAKYEKFVSFYDGARVDLRAMRFRALSHPKNDQTVTAVDDLMKLLGKMETMHQEGLSPNDISQFRIWFENPELTILKLENAKKGEKL